MAFPFHGESNYLFEQNQTLVLRYDLLVIDGGRESGAVDHWLELA